MENQTTTEALDLGNIETTETSTEEVVDNELNIDEIDTEETLADPETTDEDSEEIEEDIENLFDEEDLEDPNKYLIGGYNLDKYKELISLDNEEDVKEFSDYMLSMKEKGFTQEQVEFMIDEEIAEDAQEKPKLDKKSIKEKLSNSLTLEEKRNYKALNNFISSAIQGTDMEGSREKIMMNPALVKLVNTIYKKTLGKTTNINRTNSPKEGRRKTISIESAYDTINQAMSTGENIDKVIKDLKSQVSDKQGFKDLLKIIGK